MRPKPQGPLLREGLAVSGVHGTRSIALLVRRHSCIGVVIRRGLHGRHHDAPGAAIHVHQALAAHGRANQTLARPLDGELKSGRPDQGVVAVDLELVIVQIDVDDFLYRAR